jgi:hypothetical protein
LSVVGLTRMVTFFSPKMARISVYFFQPPRKLGADDVCPGTAFEDVFGQLFPIVGIAEGCRIIENFGSGGQPFKYKFDVDITELQDEVTFGESNASAKLNWTRSESTDIL